MENKEKGMFTGFSKVFNFTAAQNVKGKGFKSSTILIGLLLTIICAAVSIIMAVSQLEDDTKAENVDSAMDIEAQFDVDISYINASSISDEIIEEMFKTKTLKHLKVSKVEKSDEDIARNNTNEYAKDNKKCLVMYVSEDNEKIGVEFLMPYDVSYDKEVPETLGSAFVSYFNYIKVSEYVTLSEYQMELYMAGTTYGQAVKMGEEPQDIGVMLAKLLVPLAFSVVLYSLILVYGQNITKIVVAEKSSKLMEMLLTSVKPYAIISGKVLAVTGVAILQFLIWVAFAIVGCFAGGAIAESINPEYINYIEVIMELIASSSDAFTVGALVCAVVMVLAGFFMYAVFAGLVAAFVDKMEDISTATTLYQLPVIVGFMCPYFGTLLESDIALKISRVFPVTAPFAVPADVLIGKMSILEAVISIATVLAVTFVTIIITGKVYKGRLFNRH